MFEVFLPEEEAARGVAVGAVQGVEARVAAGGQSAASCGSVLRENKESVRVAYSETEAGCSWDMVTLRACVAVFFWRNALLSWVFAWSSRIDWIACVWISHVNRAMILILQYSIVISANACTVRVIRVTIVPHEWPSAV